MIDDRKKHHPVMNGELQVSTIFRPHSHCFVFVMMRFCWGFCCTKATRSHFSVFVQKRSKKCPFLRVHIDPPDNKYGANDIRFRAFTLLRFCEAHSWVLERFQKPPFLCFQIDLEGFENLRFCGYPLSIAFLKTSVFVAFLCGSV